MNRIKKKLLVQLNYFWLLYKKRTYAKNVGWDIVTKPFHLRLNRLNQADYTQLSIIKQIDSPICSNVFISSNAAATMEQQKEWLLFSFFFFLIEVYVIWMLVPFLLGMLVVIIEIKTYHRFFSEKENSIGCILFILYM